MSDNKEHSFMDDEGLSDPSRNSGLRRYKCTLGTENHSFVVNETAETSRISGGLTTKMYLAQPILNSSNITTPAQKHRYVSKFSRTPHDVGVMFTEVSLNPDLKQRNLNGSFGSDRNSSQIPKRANTPNTTRRKGKNPPNLGIFKTPSAHQSHSNKNVFIPEKGSWQPSVVESKYLERFHRNVIWPHSN